MTKRGRRLLSKRATKRIEALYALVLVGDDGAEGIWRRDTPSGTQPWITDDAKIIERMKLLACQESSIPDEMAAQLSVVKFVRA